MRDNTHQNLENFEDGNQTLKQMDFCLRRLKRLMEFDDDFIHPEYKKRLETEELVTLKHNEKTGNYEIISSLTNKDLYRYLEWEERHKNREINLLFDTIKKYIQFWWW